jgi:glucose 1-dehydrogenase
MRSFENKIAIVTGAGQGIGFEVSAMLVAEGAVVFLNDLDTSLAESAARQLTASSKGACIPIPGDCSDIVFIRKMVKQAVDKFGRLDIAIANAGITLFGDFLSYSLESFNKVMQVNLGGTFFLAQEAARQMKEQKDGGSLLFMSSVTGHQAHKDLSAYAMSKAAIEMLARNLVMELSQYKINVNALAPGATLTERTRQDPNYEEVWSRLSPLGKPGTTTDVANAALFLVSDSAKHITGQTLIIDGGWSCVSPSPY